MVVNIWSDIRCPFCYIGKRKFEIALNRFAHRDRVQVIWRSFQLDPELRTQRGVTAYDYLARVKGISREHSVKMHEHVEQAGRDVGLVFNFDRAVVANSFNAHRLLQLANTRRLGAQAGEALFRAHFTEGKDIDDTESLVAMGVAIGIPGDDVRRMLDSDAFSADVEQDETLARSMGIRAVPFYILHDSYAVSGAQSPDIFHQALEQAWEGFDRSLQRVPV